MSSALWCRHSHPCSPVWTTRCPQDPADLNGIPGKPGERGGNGLEVLGYLGVGSQLCPDGEKFAALFARLVRVDGYGENALNGHATSPGSIAFFDYRLAFTSFLMLSMSKSVTCKHIILHISSWRLLRARHWLVAPVMTAPWH